MKVCNRCVLPETYEGIEFDRYGVCNYCNAHRRARENQASDCFASEGEVIKCLAKYKNRDQQYDVVVSLSGGVDSGFALIKLVETYKLRPLVFHNDHGFEDEIATDNARKLCRHLNVDLIIWQNDLTFMKKLWKYFNEAEESDLSACFVCANMLYFNALRLAEKFNIKLVVNGYSKGQIRLQNNQKKSREWYGEMIEVILATGDRAFFEEFTGKWKLLEKQKIFQTRQDLEDNVDADKILFVPFFAFEFYKTDKEKLKKICRERFDWQPMATSYPARTTNCRMIWLNTYFDLKRLHFSVYHDEYSTLIREGEISRQQAIADLAFKPPPGLLEHLASEIGVDLEI